MAAGYNVNRLVAAATTNATLVKAAPGAVSGGCVSNVAAYAVFLKLYDSATIPTAGAGTPKMTIGIPAAFCGSLGDFGIGPNQGVPFLAGIGYTITKLSADNDTTVLVAGDAIINLFFQ
jgi:hypothetical protein